MAPLVPELDVSDLSRSLTFYVDVIGFTLGDLERPLERFVDPASMTPNSCSRKPPVRAAGSAPHHWNVHSVAA